MTGLSQSAFLQALGWATLNSIWQMALLWCCFLGANYLFKLTASKKYFLSVASLIGGTAWFASTFLLYYNGYIANGMNLSQVPAVVSLQGFLPTILTAASVTYLLLLLIPAYRLFFNWQNVQRIRKYGLKKIDVRYKLFVEKIAKQLGIRNSVGIFLSDRVKSPLTIGYLKPLILLPLASINNLTPQQVEAVLLHELSHIKRFDYLVNIIISIINTLLYFNPFAKLLIRVVQEERENCCDQMVLQFGYDKVSYASALLSLEKTSMQYHTFVLGAAGKRNLLSRIEKIVGVEKKIAFQFNHIMGLVAGLFCIVIFNSLLITSRQNRVSSISFNNIANPFYFFEDIETPSDSKPSNKKPKDNRVPSGDKFTWKKDQQQLPLNSPDPYLIPDPQTLPQAIPVSYNELKLSKQKEDHIKTTLENTKKVLTTYEWKEVEKTIADGLTPAEKAAVHQEYLNEVKEIDWENMERGLQAAYETINWEEIDGTLKTALTSMRLDSLQKTCEQTLKVLEKVHAEAKTLSNLSLLPFPDESIDTIKKREEEVQTRLDRIKAHTDKKVIKL
jgi:beta-lactamase regulating signal transducer with metallopeptidase domain